MKKLLAMGFTLSMIVLSFAGCTSNKPSNSSSTTSTTSSTSTVAEGGLKTGLAVISSIAKSTDAGEKAGLAQVDSTVVAVTVDKDGKIADCFIDAVQTKVNFTTQGKITTDLATEIKTKMELGTAYGMGKASKIKKEWNEQAAALASYVVGKTVAEVKGISVNAEGAPSGSDLNTSVTISISGFITAIEKAVTNAKELGAKSGDKLGLGIVTNIAKSKDVSDKDGVAQAYSTYAAVTFGSDSKITSCAIDASQSNVNFSKAGKITSDKAAALQTKDELGDKYGMKSQSSIKKEWYEEADAFAKYVVGKTSTEVNGIAVNEEKAPTGADLKTSVTISVGDFMKIIEKANANAK